MDRGQRLSAARHSRSAYGDTIRRANCCVDQWWPDPASISIVQRGLSGRSDLQRLARKRVPRWRLSRAAVQILRLATAWAPRERPAGMTDFRESGEAAPIESVDQLVEEFHLAGKPRERWTIGTEYEKLVVDPRTGQAVPFSGARGIETLLRELSERFDWEPQEES